MFLLFVIGSPGHVINPLQKRVMTSQVAVIATARYEAGSNPDLVVCIWIASFLAMTVHVARHCELRGTKQEAIQRA